MAYGKRRDEWSRVSTLLMLVDNRTAWGEDFTPSTPLEWWPRDLVEATDVEAMRAAETKSSRTISMKEMLASQGLANSNDTAMPKTP